MNINFTLVSQMVWFFAFVWFTSRFVWPPLMRAIDERQQKIAAGLAAAEKGQHELVNAQGRVDELMKSAKLQSQDLVTNAQKRASASIEQEIQQAREQLRTQVAQLALSGAEQVLLREIDAAKHKDVLDKLSARL